jgi:hypothetical protein
MTLRKNCCRESLRELRLLTASKEMWLSADYKENRLGQKTFSLRDPQRRRPHFCPGLRGLVRND